MCARLRAAAEGNVDSMANLGNTYAHCGVVADMHMAVKWWKRAAEAGKSDAQFHLV